MSQVLRKPTEFLPASGEMMKAQDQDIAGLMHRQGFLRIEKLASSQDVETIIAALRRIQQGRKGVSQGAQFDFVGEGDTKTMSFPQILNPSKFASELLKTAYFKTALDLARQLLGPEARFTGDHAMIKPARLGPETPWHQDEAFRDPAFEGNEISIWLALRPTTLENGCMRFIPGSQNFGVLEHRRLGGNSDVHALECIGDFNPEDAVECPIPAGGVTVHSCLTLHGAGPNISDQDRFGYVLIFEVVPTPARVPRSAPWLATPAAREKLERSWQKHGGILLHLWFQLRRYDLRDGKQLRYALSRGRNLLTKVFK